MAKVTRNHTAERAASKRATESMVIAQIAFSTAFNEMVEKAREIGSPGTVGTLTRGYLRAMRSELEYREREAASALR